MRLTLHNLRRNNGFSLIELSILLAVLGLLLGGIVIPLGNTLREESYRNTNFLIIDAIDAIVGYAVTNNSPGIVLHYGETRETGRRVAAIEAGRPYLPCPDTDGDGLEDRTALSIPIIDRLERNDLYVRSTGVIVSTDLASFDSTGAARRNPFGSCEAFYGGLPWRTLGVDPTDTWGSLLSYVVNPNFAIGAFGFDQHTRANTINYFANFTSTEAASEFPDEAWLPLLPCQPFNTLVCTVEASLALDSRARYGITSNLPVVFESYNLDSRGDSDRSLYSQFEHINYIDGLPFAVISHGPNKSGAGVSASPGTLTCNSAASASVWETSNAYYGLCNVSGNISIPSPYASGTDYRINVYAYERVPLDKSSSVVIGPYQTDNDSTFDDLVGWLTRRELASRLRAQNVLPVPAFDGTFVPQTFDSD